MTRTAIPLPARVATKRVIEKGRWAGRDLTFVSEDGGRSFVAGTGEPGVIIGIHCPDPGKFVARLEHRVRGNSWAGEIRRSIPLALASLQHEVKRISRAGNVRPGGVA